MKKICALCSFLLAYSTVLSACGDVAPQPTPTATIKPSETPFFTSTLPPVSTATSEATSTHTPVPTATVEETFTHTPVSTNTLVATPKPSLTPSPECIVPKGIWESSQTTYFPVESPILIFHVNNCSIISFDISVYPVPNELFWYPFDGLNVPITGNTFTATLKNPYGVGELTIQGEFDNETSSHGSIQFPKGFFVVDYALEEEVVIPWDASP